MNMKTVLTIALLISTDKKLAKAVKKKLKSL